MTPRQEEVAQLAAEGLGYREIGEALGISPGTARNYARAVRLAANPLPAPSPMPRVEIPPHRLGLLNRPSRREAGGMVVRCAAPRRYSGVPHIYAIRRPDTREVKIGISVDPIDRLGCLQIAHGAPLELVACFPGSAMDEEALHRRFAQYRLIGEWFREEPPITAWIEANASAP